MKSIVMVILAAGVGKRFWPFTTDKTTFPFMGKPLVDYSIPRDLPPEVSRIVVVANKVNAGYFSHYPFPVPHDVVLQGDVPGMAGAVLAAAKHIGNRPVIVAIADDLADPGLMSSVFRKAKPDVFGILTIWKPRTYFPGGYVVFRDSRPAGIIEKPDPKKTPSEYVYFGGQYFADGGKVIQILEKLKGNSDDLYERMLTELMKTERFETVISDHAFVSLKYPWHVLDAMDYLFRHHFTPTRGAHIDIHNNVSIVGEVAIGSNVKIFENTKIVGPVYIGDNTIIGNNNIIRESIIGNNCVTGFNTDIARSYIGNDCWFHTNYVGDSVLEGNVSLGSGTVLANLRLDEADISSSVGGTRLSTQRNKLGAMIGRDVRIGVNASIMPGVKIGTNSKIGAGITLSTDVPSDSFCYGKTELVTRKNTSAVGVDRTAFKSKI